MNEYADDELPLPSFAEIFGDGALSNPLKKKKKHPTTGKLDPSGEETTGRWTPDEHRLFLEGIMLYGKDWKKMQPLIKTRSLVQIRTHAQKVFKKIGLKKIGGTLKRKGGKRGDEDLNDDLDDTELDNIGLGIDGVDDGMLSGMSVEQQQQLALQQHAAHQHYSQMAAQMLQQQQQYAYAPSAAHYQYAPMGYDMQAAAQQHQAQQHHMM